MLCYPLSLPASKSLSNTFPAIIQLFLPSRCRQDIIRKTPPAQPLSFHFRNGQSPHAALFLQSEWVRLQILISHFSWDHPDTGIELSSLAQTCWRLAAATHQFTGIVRSRGDLREPGQSSESTNLWNAVNIMNVLLLHNVTPAERSQRRLQQCGGVGVKWPYQCLWMFKNITYKLCRHSQASLTLTLI